tara:strand:+ start:349 stop:762 length:414 start_codon:yes stop_codon:yes gene_type:complete
MKINEALNSLETSWSRKDILVKIKNGVNSEKIVNDFFNAKQKEIEIFTNFINPKDTSILSEIEKLFYIESKLLNKIKNYSLNNNQSNYIEKDPKNDLKSFKNRFFNLSLFMMKWSNKFVYISLLLISAIALTKQAWA